MIEGYRRRAMCFPLWVYWINGRSRHHSAHLLITAKHIKDPCQLDRNLQRRYVSNLSSAPIKGWSPCNVPYCDKTLLRNLFYRNEQCRFWDCVSSFLIFIVERCKLKLVKYNEELDFSKYERECVEGQYNGGFLRQFYREQWHKWSIKQLCSVVPCKLKLKYFFLLLNLKVIFGMHDASEDNISIACHIWIAY